MKSLSSLLAAYLLVENVQNIQVDHRMYIDQSESIQEFLDLDLQLGLQELTLNRGLNQLDLAEKNLLKTYL